MGVSIGFGLGPVRVSTRLRGPRLPRGSRSAVRPRPAPQPDLTFTRREDLTAAGLHRVHVCDWIATVLVCAVAIALVYTAPIAVLLPFLVVRRHRRDHAARAAVERAALPPINPLAEARQAEALGLTESARAWRAAAQPPGDVPTVQLQRVS